MVKPTVISLFAGCGGSSLGYHMAGYEELLAIDFDKHAVEVFKLNFKCSIPTISELKRLCSFPGDFKLTGSFEKQWARLGNAVMPLQMKAIAETIKNKILNGGS